MRRAALALALALGCAEAAPLAAAAAVRRRPRTDAGLIDASSDPDAGGLSTRCKNVQATYKDLSDIHKYTIARGCAFAADTCHHDEDPPPMHTVGHFWNLINTPCNQGVAERDTWDPFCLPVHEGGEGGVLVVPGDPDASYLLVRLEADARTNRIQMPYGAQPLSDGELYVIRAWINSLIPNLSQPSDPIDYDKTPCPL